MKCRSLRILISLATTCSLASCGSRGNGAKPPSEPVRYLPSPSDATPCLTYRPPSRPVLSCVPEKPDCEHLDADTAALLDYLDRLDMYVRLYAWPLCGVPDKVP